MYDKLKQLDRNIWITRKCRIETSERLKSNSDFYHYITVYYSIFLVIISILNIGEKPNSKLSLLILSFSIALSFLSLFVTSQGYLNRYYNMKFNYLKMAELLDELNYIEARVKVDGTYEFENQLRGIGNKYNILLSTVENHSDIDYITFLINRNNDERKPTNKEIRRIRNFKILNYVWRTFLISLPFLFLFYIYYQRMNIFKIFSK